MDQLEMRTDGQNSHSQHQQVLTLQPIRKPVGSPSASTTYSSSSGTNTTSTFVGSGIKVGGNATIDAGKSFDMEGSSLEVDGALALNADSITVRAGQDTTSSSSSSEDHSTSATMGSSGDASGSMSTSKTNSDSSSTTHVNSLISAGSFTSESEELTLSGANLTAGTVDITTDTLLVESLQDTSTSSSESSGGNLGLSSNGMPSSYGTNASEDNANSTWVNNQTGIIGGDVTIKAKDTTVTGAVIAAVDIDENGNQTDNSNRKYLILFKQILFDPSTSVLITYVGQMHDAHNDNTVSHRG